jgi:hypothetical protein
MPDNWEFCFTGWIERKPTNQSRIGINRGSIPYPLIPVGMDALREDGHRGLIYLAKIAEPTKQGGD